MKKKTLRIVIPVLISLLAYLLLDYLNIPTLVGLTPCNINSDLFGILFDAVIVLILYVVSFYYIENKQNEKDKNARDPVDVLLQRTFKECLDNLKLLDYRAMIKEYIIPKLDGNKPSSENAVIHKLQILPFSSFDALMDLAINGYIEKERLNDYLDIKQEYQHLVGFKILLYDLVTPQTIEQEAIYTDTQTRDTVLKEKLKRYLPSKK